MPVTWDAGQTVACVVTCAVLSCLQGDRFSEHSAVGNRKLLWHGTKVAVVAAILKSGLRIMPHSGGRVGRGIYFASENSKSAGYGEQVTLPVMSHAYVLVLMCMCRSQQWLWYTSFVYPSLYSPHHW